jgi:hypothetical protein
MNKVIPAAMSTVLAHISVDNNRRLETEVVVHSRDLDAVSRMHLHDLVVTHEFALDVVSQRKMDTGRE